MHFSLAHLSTSSVLFLVQLSQPFFEIALAITGGIQIDFRCCPTFLDDAVQQNHLCTDHTEEDSGNAIIKIGPNFPKTAAKRIAGRHANRPPVLRLSDIDAYLLTVLFRQLLQPFANRLVAQFRAVELSGNLSLRMIDISYRSSEYVPKKVRKGKAKQPSAEHSHRRSPRQAVRGGGA
jgi:hypothetical protein